MSLKECYLAGLQKNAYVSNDENSKKSFLDYCLKTNTASFFLHQVGEEFKFALENQDFKESFLHEHKKSLQNQSSLKSFLKLAVANGIDICLIKGAFMSNFMYADFTLRSMRDIDVLVEENDLLKTVNLMLANGYYFLNSDVTELKKFNFNYAHQAPILVDRFGIAFEIHHRLKTYPELENSDLLTISLKKHKQKKILFNIPVYVPSVNFAFIHCCHHAIQKSKLNIGPIYLNDLMQFKDLVDHQILEDARKSNCLREAKLGIQLFNYLKGSAMLKKKNIEDAIEIIIYSYKLPEFLPRRKFNLISSLKESYSFNANIFSLKALWRYLKLKIKQIFVFCRSYSLNFELHRKRKMFFKDFKN